jgi:HTH-type transcriptional regulator, sugar sensing transcriptional regulator
MATSLGIDENLEVINSYSQLENDLAVELQKLGLTFNEARIVLFLMLHKNSNANDISKYTKIQRTETYGYISSLLSKGLIFSTFDRPQKYYTPSMQEVIECLVLTKQSELNILSTKKQEYQQVVDRVANNMVTPSAETKDSYQVIMGENSINAKVKRMLSNAKEEITILVAERNLINFYRAEIIDFLIETATKGMRVKLLTPCKNAVYYLTNDNGEVSTSVSLKVLSNDVPINFVLVDNKEIVVLLESPMKKQDLGGFYTNNTSLVSAFGFIFTMGNTVDILK